MKRLPYIAIAGLFLLLGWLVLRPAGPKEPSYQGRTLSEWVNDYREARSAFRSGQNTEATKQAARLAVKAIGTNAIPILLQWVQATNSTIKVKMNTLLEKQSVIHFRYANGGAGR